MSKTKKNAHLWERDPHDWYVEPEWCSERLFEVEKFEGFIHDPACGQGNILHARISHALHDDELSGADIVDRRAAGRKFYRFEEQDFLASRPPFPRDNIVSNPPFRLAENFVEHALAMVRYKIAMLLPATWHLGDKRARWLRTTPLYKIYFLTPRPSMPPGAVIEAGEQPGGGRKDFAWFIWLKGYEGPVIADWLHRDREPA